MPPEFHLGSFSGRIPAKTVLSFGSLLVIVNTPFISAKHIHGHSPHGLSSVSSLTAPLGCRAITETEKISNPNF